MVKIAICVKKLVGQRGTGYYSISSLKLKRDKTRSHLIFEMEKILFMGDTLH